jgi:hypothetical protein
LPSVLRRSRGRAEGLIASGNAAASPWTPVERLFARAAGAALPPAGDRPRHALGRRCRLLGRLGAPGSHVGLGLLVGAAILLDFGVTANLVLGQRAIFAGGAAGLALGGWDSAQGGWSLSCCVGFGLPLLVLASFLVKR